MVWSGVEKPKTSFFASSSPAFDFAVYTACFLLKPNGLCDITIDGCDLVIKVSRITQNNKIYVEAAYPIVGDVSTTCQQNYASKHQDCPPWT